MIQVALLKGTADSSIRIGTDNPATRAARTKTLAVFLQQQQVKGE